MWEDIRQSSRVVGEKLNNRYQSPKSRAVEENDQQRIRYTSYNDFLSILIIQNQRNPITINI
jgi:hypothetical protein